MSDLQSEVNRTVQGFVAQVIELVRHTAVETLQVAFTAPAATGMTASRGDRGPAAAGPGRRRTPEDLDALTRRLAMVVRASPGLRVAELGERLGTTPRDLARPIRKLLAEGVIQTRRTRRATTYFTAAAPDAEREVAPGHASLDRPADPAAGRTAGAPVARMMDPTDAGFDADWYRCLAGVFMLAHKLEK